MREVEEVVQLFSTNLVLRILGHGCHSSSSAVHLACTIALVDGEDAGIHDMLAFQKRTDGGSCRKMNG